MSYKFYKIHKISTQLYNNNAPELVFQFLIYAKLVA